MIWIVLPFSDPKYLGLALSNVARQVCEYRLLVVENGNGVGRWTGPCDLKLVSGESKAEAMNVGVGHLQKIGADKWRVFDQDDFYGPEAAYRSSRWLNAADVVAQTRKWVVLGGMLFMLQTRATGFRSTCPGYIYGGSIGGHAHQWKPMDGGLGQTVRWGRSMTDAGHSLCLTEDHEVWFNRPGSMWDVTDAEALASLVPPSAQGALVFGAWAEAMVPFVCGKNHSLHKTTLVHPHHSI